MKTFTGTLYILLQVHCIFYLSMNTFDDRKKGFEAKYQQDEEAMFRLRALRNKLVGQWAASLMNPHNIEDYIKEVRISDLEKPGDDDIIDKLMLDLVTDPDFYETIRKFNSQPKQASTDVKKFR